MTTAENFRIESRYYINRKELHYLLSKFLLKKRLVKRFYNSSINFKMKNDKYSFIYSKYNFTNKDTFSEHLYKCIDIFTKEEYVTMMYHYNIMNFFQSVATTFTEDWAMFWMLVSDEWKKEVSLIRFKQND